MSRFVSGGINEEPTERDEEWLKAQQEIDAKHLQKAKIGEQADGKSLFETLQANKAAKQEAFEESTRLRNQFRSLDEDEVEFLDSMMESTRAKEAEVKKETTEQLDAFRRQQEDAEKATKQLDAAEDTTEPAETWSAGPRKRKKGRESTIGGVKIRRTSSIDKPAVPAAAAAAKQIDEPEAPQGAQAKLELKIQKSETLEKSADKAPQSPASVETPAAISRDGSASKPPTSTAPSGGLGLGAYSSDEED